MKEDLQNRLKDLKECMDETFTYILRFGIDSDDPVCAKERTQYYGMVLAIRALGCVYTRDENGKHHISLCGVNVE